MDFVIEKVISQSGKVWLVIRNKSGDHIGTWAIIHPGTADMISQLQPNKVSLDRIESA